MMSGALFIESPCPNRPPGPTSQRTLGKPNNETVELSCRSGAVVPESPFRPPPGMPAASVPGAF